jgi:hypothetical protein
VSRKRRKGTVVKREEKDNWKERKNTRKRMED